MEPMAAPGEQTTRKQPGNDEKKQESDSKLESVLSFWGSYCFADVSGWTQDEVEELSDSLGAVPESVRRNGLIRGTE